MNHFANVRFAKVLETEPVMHMYILCSLSHDTQKCDTYAYIPGLFFKPLITHWAKDFRELTNVSELTNEVS